MSPRRGKCNLCGRTRAWQYQILSSAGLSVAYICDVCASTKTLAEIVYESEHGAGEFTPRHAKARRRFEDLIYEEIPPQE